jgi:hypothetical protein
VVSPRGPCLWSCPAATYSVVPTFLSVSAEGSALPPLWAHRTLGKIARHISARALDLGDFSLMGTMIGPRLVQVFDRQPARLYRDGSRHT